MPMNPVDRTSAPDVAERIEILDLIRGFTLCGILFANILWFSGFLHLAAADRQSMLGGFLDEATLFLIRVLVHAKFYHIFAFLFGLGFALQLHRHSAGIRRLFTRRLFLLLLFGLLHSLIWWGDIVRYYAVLGLTLLAFRHCSNRQLIIWIGAFSILPVLMGHAQALWHLGPSDFSVVDVRAREWLTHVREASPWQLFVLNLQQIVDHFTTNVGNGRIFRILAMFLAGLLAGRLGIFADPHRYRAEIRRILWPSLAVGIVGNLISVSFYYQKWGLSFDTISLLRDWIGLVSVPALALFYVAALLTISMTPPERSPLHRALRQLIPAGRMALTNYLLQTMIAVAIFHPALGGLYGRLGVFQCALLVLMIYTAQLLISHAWLARYRFGPLEWLWRSGTRGQWQPLRR